MASSTEEEDSLHETGALSTGGSKQPTNGTGDMAHASPRIDFTNSTIGNMFGVVDKVELTQITPRPLSGTEDRLIEEKVEEINNTAMQLEKQMMEYVHQRVNNVLTGEVTSTVDKLTENEKSLLGLVEEDDRMIEELKEVGQEEEQEDVNQWVRDEMWTICRHRMQVQLHVAFSTMKDCWINTLSLLSIRREVLTQVFFLTPGERKNLEHGTELLSQILSQKDGLYVFHFLCFIKMEDKNRSEELFKYYEPVSTFSHDDKEQVSPGLPILTDRYTPRLEFEKRIRRELMSGHRAAIVLTGLSSSGKTCLAVHAASTALSLGYHRVLWQSLSKENKEIEELLNWLTKQKYRRLLLVIDDLEEEHAKQWLKLFVEKEAVKSIIITSKLRSFEIPQKMKKTILQVGGLTSEESKGLMANILGKDMLEQIERAGLMEEVMNLCVEWSSFPLMICVITSLLSSDVEMWSKGGTKYLSNLREQMEDAKKNFENKDNTMQNPEDYDYSNSLAAIYMTIMKLDAQSQQRLKALVLLQRGECISPVTAAVIWGTGKAEAERQMKLFVQRHHITYRGCNQQMQQEYYLHDLIFDLLAQWVQGQERQTIISSCIDNYWEMRGSGAFDCVSDHDDVFWRHFLTWCLEVGRKEKAVETVCNLPYISRRRRLLGLEDVVETLEAIGEMTEAGEELDQFVRAAARYEDPVQFALLTPRMKSVRRQAKEMLDSGSSFSPPLLLLPKDPEKPDIDALSSKRADDDQSDACQVREVLSLEWRGDIHDFVAVVVEANQLIVFLIRQKERLITEALPSSDLDLQVVHTATRVAFGVREKEKVTTVALLPDPKTTVVEMGGRVLALDVASDGETILAVVASEKGSSRVVRVDEAGPSELVTVSDENWQITKVVGCNGVFVTARGRHPVSEVTLWPRKGDDVIHVTDIATSAAVGRKPYCVTKDLKKVLVATRSSLVLLDLEKETRKDVYDFPKGVEVTDFRAKFASDNSKFVFRFTYKLRDEKHHRCFVIDGQKTTPVSVDLPRHSLFFLSRSGDLIVSGTSQTLNVVWKAAKTELINFEDVFGLWLHSVEVNDNGTEAVVELLNGNLIHFELVRPTPNPATAQGRS